MDNGVSERIGLSRSYVLDHVCQGFGGFYLGAADVRQIHTFFVLDEVFTV
jgi:hypothetical protein